jgi:hypothetical protein
MRLRREGNNEDMRATVRGETAMSATLTKQGRLELANRFRYAIGEALLTRTHRERAAMVTMVERKRQIDAV